MLKNLKIGAKLGLAFLVLSLLILAVGVVGIVNQGQLAGLNTSLIEDSLPGVLKVAKVRKSTVDYDRILFEHISQATGADFSGLEKELEADKNLIMATMSDYEKSVTNPEILPLVKSVQEELPRIWDATPPILALSRLGKDQDALKLNYATVDPVFDRILNDLNTIVDVYTKVSGQAEIASRQIDAASSTTMLVLIALAILFSVLIGWTLQRAFRKPLNLALGLSNAITSGDLSFKVDPKSLEAKDEFGQLMRALNAMQEDLAHSVSQIDSSSKALGEVGTQLDRAIEDTGAAVGAIGQTVEEVNTRVQNQATSVTETSATINQIVKSIEGLRQDIDTQASSVTQSSASIEQMMSNIQSVTRNVEQMGDEFTKLLGASDNGKAKLTVVTERVKIVGDQSRRLLAANSVIKGIAAQTNLLAMNAAIEAAHAGDAGRGFAVVADEIRKLAELSSKQSGEISKDIASILKEITTVVGATTDSEKTFGVILEEITILNRYEQEIKQAMLEQNEGSRQILEAIAQINEITSHVKDSATEITEGSQLIGVEMNNLATVSEELNASMHRIDEGTRGIQRATTLLEDAGQRNAEQISALAGVVAKFRM